MGRADANEWQRATVVESSALTPAITRIALRPERPRPAVPGAHVDVRIALAGETVTRSYSIVDSGARGEQFALSVYESPTSRGGASAMQALRPGDRVDVTVPIDGFPLRYGAPSYVLLAGGVGITAMVSMARALQAAKADYRLVYCGRSRAQMAYLSDLHNLHGTRLETHVSDEGQNLDVAALVRSIDSSGELYMCGPIRLMDAVRRAWVAEGRSPTQLRFETFGNSGWHSSEAFTVRILGRDERITVPPNSTLLEALEASGIDALSDCRKGECGLCEARVIELDGAIDHRDVFYSERQRDASSRICVCVSRVCGAIPGQGQITVALS